MRLSAIKNIASYGVALCIMKGTSLLMLPLITRYLSPTEYGQLELLTVTSSFIALLTCCSLHEAIYRFALHDKKNESFERVEYKANQIFTITQLVSLGLMLGIGFTALCFYQSVEALLSHYHLQLKDIVILSLSLCIGGSLSIGLAWLRMKDDIKNFVVISITTTLIQALCVLLLLEYGYGITGVLLAGLFTHLMQWFWVTKTSGLQFVTPTRLLFSLTMKYTIPLTASTLVAFGLNGAERWLVLASSDLETLGQYAIASKFALAACILMQPFGMWWMPKRFAMLNSDVRITERISLLGIVLIGVIIISVAATSQLLLTFVLTTDYQFAITLILGTLFMVLGKEMAELINLGILYQKQTNTLFAINSATTILGISGCVFFLDLGVWAVMIIIGVFQLIKALSVFYYSQRAFHVFSHAKILIAVPVISACSLFGIYCASSPVMVSVIALIALLLFLTMALTLTSPEHRITLRRALSQAIRRSGFAHD